VTFAGYSQFFVNLPTVRCGVWPSAITQVVEIHWRCW